MTSQISTIGLIAEYNPFHNGHAYQLAKIRELCPDATIVVCMSGSFTQRGLAAVADKWTRAEWAVRGGANLVLELPYAFACRSAEHFATGGVQCLAGLGCVDALAFGAEAEHIEPLEKASACMDDDTLQAAVHERIQNGASYAVAMSGEVTKRTGVAPEVLRAPNNILGMEYLRAMRKFAPEMKAVLVQRVGADYHDTDIHGSFASASAIRAALESPAPSQREPEIALQHVMPEDCFATLMAALPDRLPRQDLLLRPLLSRLLLLDAASISSICGMGEGLEHRLLSMAQEARSWEGLIGAMATRRYPRSRIARLLVHVLKGFTAEAAAAFDATGPRYLRVLAMNARGAKLLHQAKKAARLPIITKTSQFLKSQDLLRPCASLTPLQQMLLFDVRATELRELAVPERGRTGADFCTSPLYVKQ